MRQRESLSSNFDLFNKALHNCKAMRSFKPILEGYPLNDNFIYLSIGSLLLLIISIPLALKKIKPNRWYGVRTKLTLNNSQAWYQANRVYGLSMIFTVIFFFLMSALSGIWHNDNENNYFALVLFLIEISVPFVITFFKLIAIKKK
ncbi:TPA: SdpI family protein [Salmonella enterica subsp. enterica serovar Java]